MVQFDLSVISMSEVVQSVGNSDLLRCRRAKLFFSLVHYFTKPAAVIRIRDLKFFLFRNRTPFLTAAQASVDFLKDVLCISFFLEHMSQCVCDSNRDQKSLNPYNGNMLSINIFKYILSLKQNRIPQHDYWRMMCNR